MGQWVGSGQITKNLIYLDLIEIIQFFLVICEGAPTYVWVCGCFSRCVFQWVGSGQITNYQINLDLIGIISILFEDL